MPAFRWFRRRRGPAGASNRAAAEGPHEPTAPTGRVADAQAGRPPQAGSAADAPATSQSGPPAGVSPDLPVSASPDLPAGPPPLVPDPPTNPPDLVPADPQADFNALVLSVAEDLGWSGTVQDGALHRRAPTADLLGLANLEQMCRQLPRVCWPDIVRSHFEQMDRASRNPVDRGDWITVRPLVRTAVYPDGYFPARVRNEVAARRLTEGLLETVVLDLPESVTVVFQRDLTTWPLDLNQALQAGKAALRNEHRLAPEMITVNEEEVVGLESENLLTATHVCWLDDYLDVTAAGAMVALPNAAPRAGARGPKQPLPRGGRAAGPTRPARLRPRPRVPDRPAVLVDRRPARAPAGVDPGGQRDVAAACRVRPGPPRPPLGPGTMVALARSLSEQITIAAHPKAIMAVIEDLDRLPQWVHPMKLVQIHERFPDERPKLVHFWVMTPLVRDDFLLEFEWEGDHRVSWRQVAGRLLREQVGSYTLTDVGKHTQVRYDLAVLMKLPIPGFIQRLATEIIMAHALSGLKAQVEQASR